MSYETVTLRDCGPFCCQVMPTHSRFSSLGLLPFAAIGVKSLGVPIVGKLFGSIFGGETPAQAAARYAKNVANFGRAIVPMHVKLHPGSAAAQRWRQRIAPLPASPVLPTGPSPAVPFTNTIDKPTPGSQAMMMVPTSMAESGPASGGGVESSNGAAPTPAPSMAGAGPLIVGGLILFAVSRFKRKR